LKLPARALISIAKLITALKITPKNQRSLLIEKKQKNSSLKFRALRIGWNSREKVLIISNFPNKKNRYLLLFLKKIIKKRSKPFSKSKTTIVLKNHCKNIKKILSIHCFTPRELNPQSQKKVFGYLKFWWRIGNFWIFIQNEQLDAAKSSSTW
jgi:hypothetical protein